MSDRIPPTYLYVLRLAGNKLYIGITQNVQQRYEEHRRGNGAAWTRRFQPVKLEESRPFSEEAAARSEETRRTCELMLIHGVNNVRGGELAHSRDYTTGDLDRLIYTIGHHLNMAYDVVQNRIQQELQARFQTSSSPGAGTNSQPSTSAGAGAKSQPSSKTRAGEEQPAVESSSSSSRIQYRGCARCGRLKETDDSDKPLCRTCWERNVDTFKCARCGGYNDRDVPLCYPCWTVWSNNDERAKVSRACGSIVQMHAKKYRWSSGRRVHSDDKGDSSDNNSEDGEDDDENDDEDDDVNDDEDDDVNDDDDNDVNDDEDDDVNDDEDDDVNDDDDNDDEDDEEDDDDE